MSVDMPIGIDGHFFENLRRMENSREASSFYLFANDAPYYTIHKFYSENSVKIDFRKQR